MQIWSPVKVSASLPSVDDFRFHRSLQIIKEQLTAPHPLPAQFLDETAFQPLV